MSRTTLSRAIAAATLAAGLSAGCGGSSGESAGPAPSEARASAGTLAGDYGGDQCLYDKLTFSDSGLAYLTVFGTDQAGEYRVDGERIVVTVGNQSVVFTRNGRDLEANLLGDRMVCSPLAAAAGEEIYEATTDEGRIRLELLAREQARVTMTAAGSGERMTIEVPYRTQGDGITIEMPGDDPLRLLRDGRDLVSSDGEAVRFVRR